MLIHEAWLGRILSADIISVIMTNMCFDRATGATCLATSIIPFLQHSYRFMVHKIHVQSLVNGVHGGGVQAFSQASRYLRRVDE